MDKLTVLSLLLWECAQWVDKLTVLRAGGDYFTEKVKRTGTIHTDTKGHLWRYRVLFTDERLFTERLLKRKHT